MLRLALLLAGFAWGAEAPPASPGEGPRLSAGQFGSVKRVMAASDAMAKQWSPTAKLYSIQGEAPRNADAWMPEKWQIHYGDPETQDGHFLTIFHDGALEGRQGVRGEVKLTEFFNQGKFVSRKARLVEWETTDYKNCLPAEEPFLDSVELERIIRDLELVPEENDQFRLSLIRAKNDDCDGLGHPAQFIREKPIPKELREKTLWIISSRELYLYVDAKTGKPLLRRTRLKKHEAYSEPEAPDDPAAP